MESGILPESRKISIGQSLQGWLGLLIEYFELKIQLLGLESKEAGLHVLGLALLLVSALTLFAGFLAMLVVFFLYLLTLMASSVKEPFNDPDWIFETKLDGYRAVTGIDQARQVTFRSHLHRMRPVHGCASRQKAQAIPMVAPEQPQCSKTC
jgi:hypothetical protein